MTGRNNDVVLPPRHGLSLCAGGGGLDMGLELAEPGFATACYVEIEEYPRSTLIAAQRAGYFKPAPIWDDLKSFNARPWRGQIDTLLAGYPCQPFSEAGRRKGEDDPRHLWPDIQRTVMQLGDELRWCFFENVAGHLSLGLEAVVNDLREMGFNVAVGLFSAQETGASHERQRVFIVAYRHSKPDERWRRPNELPSQEGTPHKKAQQRERDGDTTHYGSATVAHCVGPRSQGQLSVCPIEKERQIQTVPFGLRGGARVFPPYQNDQKGWGDTLSCFPEGAPALSIGDLSDFSRYFAALVETGELSQTEAEQRLCRMADGMAARTRALRLLGNGVHPLAAAYAWRTLAASHGLGSVDLGTD